MNIIIFEYQITKIIGIDYYVRLLCKQQGR